NLRLRPLPSTLPSTPILIDDIRHEDTWPGLRPHEVPLLRLFVKVCEDCVVEINETGTKLKYEPGILVGGKHFVHDCGVSRSIGYFLELLIVPAWFGITNDSKNLSVDTFCSTTLPMLKHFGVPLEGLGLKIESRGAHPLGGGEVVLTVPIIHSSLTVSIVSTVTWIDEAMVKRIRGVSFFSTRVSSQFEHAMIHSAHGIFNHLLPDVHIFTDHKAGPQAGNCFISVDTAISHGCEEGTGDLGDVEKKELIPPGIGEQIDAALLEEIKQGGVVDSMHQELLFLLCALCPPDISKVRVGKLSPYAIETLRHIWDFLGVTFTIKPDPKWLFSSLWDPDCRESMMVLGVRSIDHVFREANQCADMLARLGRNALRECCVSEDPPVEVTKILQLDTEGKRANPLKDYSWQPPKPFLYIGSVSQPPESLVIGQNSHSSASKCLKTIKVCHSSSCPYEKLSDEKTKALDIVMEKV
ncbi:RNA 3'-terminal phosphate cyclase domain, partial [Dillenia turbinata]